MHAHMFTHSFTCSYNTFVSQRLRQLASRKKDTSGYEALRARILDCLMALFKYVYCKCVVIASPIQYIQVFNINRILVIFCA